MLIDAAIWKGVESLKRSYTFFVTSFPYTDPNEEITFSSGSFRNGSSNNERSDMSASMGGGDADFSTDGGGLKRLLPSLSPMRKLGVCVCGGGGGGV